MTLTIKEGWCSGALPDDTGRLWPVIQRRQASARGRLSVATPNLILHTTETDGYIDQLRYPSQWQCGEGVIGQHIQLGFSGDSVNEWDRYAQQIEMVGRSRLERWLPGEATLGPTVALVAWLHKTGRIKTGLKRPTLWPVVLDQGPQAVTTYYRRLQKLWPSEPGVYGHVEIPANSHWDPGSFDYPRFFARVQTAIEREDDMTPEQEAKLNKLWNYLEALATELGQSEPKAAAAGTRVAKATKKVEEGLPPAGPHEHNLIGKAE